VGCSLNFSRAFDLISGYYSGSTLDVTEIFFIFALEALREDAPL
jgi:hypothetical protein